MKLSLILLLIVTIPFSAMFVGESLNYADAAGTLRQVRFEAALPFGSCVIGAYRFTGGYWVRTEGIELCSGCKRAETATLPAMSCSSAGTRPMLTLSAEHLSLAGVQYLPSVWRP